MLKDADARVIPSVLAALVKLKAPAAGQVLLDALKNPDAGRAQRGRRRPRAS